MATSKLSNSELDRHSPSLPSLSKLPPPPSLSHGVSSSVAIIELAIRPASQLCHSKPAVRQSSILSLPASPPWKQCCPLWPHGAIWIPVGLSLDRTECWAVDGALVFCETIQSIYGLGFSATRGCFPAKHPGKKGTSPIMDTLTLKQLWEPLWGERPRGVRHK